MSESEIPADVRAAVLVRCECGELTGEKCRLVVPVIRTETVRVGQREMRVADGIHAQAVRWFGRGRP